MKRFLLTLVFFGCLIVGAQNATISKGDIYFESYEYNQAINSYRKALEQTKDSAEIQYARGRIALCYAYLFKYDKAEEYFAMLMENGNNVAPELYKEYGHVLKLNGKYAESKEQYIRYRELNPSKEADGYIQSVEWAMNNTGAVNSTYRIYATNLDVNGQALGYCFYGEGLIYCNARNKEVSKGKRPVFDIDYAISENSLEFTGRKDFFSNINFAFNEMSPSISADEKRLFFAANTEVIKNGKSRRRLDTNKEGIANYSIYVASKQDAEFANISALTFNNNTYSCIHPCILSDGKTLVFSSDMPGGFGGFDLYKSTLSEDSIWGVPVNLGATVNSTENELFPWVNGNHLYFASKGFSGYGGYDIFITTLSSEYIPEGLKNMGLPINSFRDDVAYITADSGATGYFSSNRDDNNGTDRVYYFKSAQAGRMTVAAVHTMGSKDKLGMSFNDSLGIPMLNTIGNDKWMGHRSTDPHALESINETTGKVPAVEKKNEHSPTIVSSTKIKTTQTTKAEIAVIKEFTPILFTFNDAHITAAQKQLADSVAVLFKKQPHQKISIKAYTDSRGSAQYNIGLSQRRAASVKQYLLSKGIPARAIQNIALGESELLNECSDGVMCSEEQHAVNRRVLISLIEQ